MSHYDLTQKKCVPCEGGVPALTALQAEGLVKSLDGWQVAQKEITKEYSFGNFVQAIKFVNHVAEVAESEGHHPDIFLHQYNKVKISLSTHAVGGLTENDFIVASKIDKR